LTGLIQLLGANGDAKRWRVMEGEFLGLIHLLGCDLTKVAVSRRPSKMASKGNIVVQIKNFLLTNYWRSLRLKYNIVDY
jgi:hypothetical protein